LAKAFPTQSPFLKSEIIPLYQRLSTDDQDSVRLLTIPDLIAICTQMDKEEIKTDLARHLQESWTDKSWRVRYMLADHFVELANAVGEDIVREELVKAFTELLSDNEAEVRTAAAGQIPGERYGSGLIVVFGSIAYTGKHHSQASLSLWIGMSSSPVSSPVSGP
jgi:serine/threonine-protein phosphatase 2A regulatory subunit A